MTTTSESTTAETGNSYGEARSRYIDPQTGKFDPTRLPLLPIEDKKGRVTLYLQAAYRILWWNQDHPLGDHIRLIHRTIHEQHRSFVRCEIVDTNVDRYLRTNDGGIAVIPGPDGTPEPALNPAHVLHADEKTIVPGGKGDPVEKAITGAIGRVLARAGYGTEAAMELLQDDAEDVVDAPLADDECGRYYDMVVAKAERAGLSEESLRSLKDRVIGPNATADTMGVDDYKKLLAAIPYPPAAANRPPAPQATSRETTKNTGATAAAGTPPPTDIASRQGRAQAAQTNDAVKEAREKMLELKAQYDVPDEKIIDLIKEGKANWNTGDPLSALDYARVARCITEAYGGAPKQQRTA